MKVFWLSTCTSGFDEIYSVRGLSEANAYVTTTLGSVNLEFFFWKAIGNVNVVQLRITMTDEKEAIRGTEGNGNERNSISIFTFTSAAVIGLCCLYYVNTTSEVNLAGNSTSNSKQDENEIAVPVKINRIINIQYQPNCTKQEYFGKTLKDISLLLYTKKLLCTPEDAKNLKKHNVPNFAPKKVAEPKGYVVIYIAVGLLLVSLVAAFLDVYKVKGKPCKSKPPLTKRCSLADLTVLRHTRRESMKKDSMYDDHRIPLKLLGRKVSRTPSLHLD
ncbi:hypothetical protein FQA39_LY03168 [Lamprigera yunnana]|nr:hypothetical protein FQA39_LY03168 [Lamprigera yunnana]